MTTGKLEYFLKKTYGGDQAIFDYQKNRYDKLINEHISAFGKNKLFLFSSPGRTEISGNHTDHNNGKVLAASVNLDSIAAVSASGTPRVKLLSSGFREPFNVDLSRLEAADNEKQTTNALIRGIAARFKALGYKIGGFNARLTSEVLPGSGLSSSASIEILIASIFNELFNDGKISAMEIAKIGQFSEINYFGKPCGLMDQLTSAVGGIIGIDFIDHENPLVEKLDFSFSAYGYKMVVVNTGGSHADLTEDYASIPAEMKKVAQYFGKSVCREITMEQIMNDLKRLTEKVGDRPLLRAIHFLKENERVENQHKAIREKNFPEFLKLVQQSGDSSIKLLQNIYSIKYPGEQKISLALAVTEDFLRTHDGGACRIHGGGFAGTILTILPDHNVKDYQKSMGRIFGDNSVIVLSIRSNGIMSLNLS